MAPQPPSAAPPKGYVWDLRPKNGRMVWTLVPTANRAKPGQKMPWGVATGREQPGQRVKPPKKKKGPGKGGDPDAPADGGESAEGQGGEEHTGENPDLAILDQWLTSMGLDDEATREEAKQKLKDGWDLGDIQTWLRTTTWFKTKFPGVEEGMKAGFFGGGAPEDDWRRYRASVNAHYRQFYGRDATDEEIGNHLRAGETSDWIGRRFYSSAWVTANEGEVQYLAGAFGPGQLNEGQMEALGNEQAGIGNALGQTLNQALQDAQARMERVFQGVLAQGSFGQTSFGTLATGNKRPDVGA